MLGDAQGDVATWRSMVTALTVIRAVTVSTTAASQGNPTHSWPVYQVPTPYGISASAGSNAV